VKVVGAEELPMVVLGDGHQSTAAMGRYHGEIATSQRRVARRSAKSAAFPQHPVRRLDFPPSLGGQLQPN
jgi:hypothetical protein